MMMSAPVNMVIPAVIKRGKALCFRKATMVDSPIKMIHVGQPFPHLRDLRNFENLLKLFMPGKLFLATEEFGKNCPVRLLRKRGPLILIPYS
jgi:hypothetical protein